MIQITIPLSCITMLSQEYQSVKKNSIKKKEKEYDIRRYTIAEALKFNSFKKGYHRDDEEREPFRFKIAGS